MKISGAIVLYKNNRNILLGSINSFLNSTGVDKLYLIDNSPTDNLKDLENLDDRIEYVFNPSNPGFGAAHNIAIKNTMANNFDYHLVLNPDIYYNNDVIKTLIEFLADKPEIGNVMPKVLYPDGSIQYLCKLLPTPYDWIGRRFNPLKNMVEKRNNLFELKFTGYDKIMEIPYLSGCFMFLKVDALRKVGLFDDGIFMYGEETDLCRRLIDGGYKTVFFPHVNIFHHFEKGSHKSWRLTKIGIQSAIYYFNKWGWIFDKRRSEINSKTLNELQK